MAATTETGSASGIGAYAHEAAAAVEGRNRDYRLRRLLAAADCVAIGLGAAIATGVTAAQPAGIERAAWVLVTLPAWILLFKIYGLYDRDAKRVSHSTVDDIPWIFHALLVGSLMLWAFYRLVPVQPPSLSTDGLFFATTFATLLVARSAARAVGRATTLPERVLFVGGNRSAALLEKKMRSHSEYHLDPVGYLADEGHEQDASLTIPYLGPVDSIDAVCGGLGIDRVLLVSSAVSEATLTDSIRRLKDLEVRISLLPRVVDALGPSVEVDDVEGVTVFGINPPMLTRSSRLLKRSTDLAIAIPIVLVTLPLMGVIALAIKLDSRGPVFYTQERIGRRGFRFRIYKFRTMVTDAEARTSELWESSRHDVWLLLDHDPRVTRIGRVLRRSSLDELPQLFNVISGSMSLVGPRPMPPDVDRRISGWGRRRLDLIPGITGLWQVLGRTSIPFEEMVTLDYLYVTNWSLWQDIRLLIHTLPAVWRRRGVN